MWFELADLSRPFLTHQPHNHISYWMAECYISILFDLFLYWWYIQCCHCHKNYMCNTGDSRYRAPPRVCYWEATFHIDSLHAVGIKRMSVHKLGDFYRMGTTYTTKTPYWLLNTHTQKHFHFYNLDKQTLRKIFVFPRSAHLRNETVNYLSHNALQRGLSIMTLWWLIALWIARILSLVYWNHFTAQKLNCNGIYHGKRLLSKNN